MQNEYYEFSKAVVLFLGYGFESSPRRDPTRLVEEFGPLRGAALELRVVPLLDELAQINVDWSTESLDSAGELARAIMQKRHPALSDAALRALAWKFTFDWR